MKLERLSGKYSQENISLEQLKNEDVVILGRVLGVAVDWHVQHFYKCGNFEVAIRGEDKKLCFKEDPFGWSAVEPNQQICILKEVKLNEL